MYTTYAETEARSLFARAGFSLSDAPGPLVLARALLGADSVHTHTGLSKAGHYLPKQRQIWMRAGLHPRRAVFVLAHELGEMALTDANYQDDDREAMCDAIASAIICPRDAFRAALRIVGRDELPQLADAFVTTQSVVGLRVSEVTGTPGVLVTPTHVHARGEPFGWPDELALRRLASARVVPIELVRTRLTDAPRRALLLAA
jgi:hypothetical protein